MADVSAPVAELLDIADNKPLLDNLVRQLIDSSVIPFVGAGLSAPYNLPQWSALIRKLAPDKPSRAHVDRQLQGGLYEQAAEYLMKIRGPHRFQLVFQREFDRPLDLSLNTAVQWLPRLPDGPIITTNFDRVLEMVFARAGYPLEVITGEQVTLVADAIQYRTSALLKIHGDFGDAASSVLTKTSYDRAYRRSLRFLLSNLASTPLLFLGCSLSTDRTIQVLVEAVRKRQVLIRHFALLALPETQAELRNRNAFLSKKANIDVIWYPARRHEFVEHVLAYVCSQLPPEKRRTHKDRKRPRYQDIPDAPFTLFGRDSTQLVSMIESSRIVCVEGDRGVGKTAFALHALRGFINRDTFDALVWVTAATRRKQLLLSHILDAISRSIDYPFKPQTRLQEKEALLREELSKKKIRCLLLLDNYETVSDPQIDGFLFDDRRLPRTLSVLITSTGRLARPGVRAFPLDVLDADAAAMMFRDRLSRAGLEQEPEPEIQRLHRVVGGNPLALEWIVGQMRGGTNKSAGKTGVQLPRILTRLERGDAPILKRVFAQSWERLGDDERTVLAGMWVFVRPALEECLVATTGVRANKFQDALDDLLARYLVKRLRIHEGLNSELGGRRYFIHPFTRDYLEGQRDAESVAAMYRRAATFYLKFIPERGGTPEREEPQGLRDLNGERENILGVLRGCWMGGERRVVAELIQLMARWLFIESHWNDLEHWGKMAGLAAKELRKPHMAARILNEVGRTFSYRSDFARAHATFEEARRLASMGTRCTGHCRQGTGRV